MNLQTIEKNGFTFVIDIIPEELYPSDLFDSSLYDIKDITSKIDNGFYSWFILRARIMFESHIIGESAVGGCLYENPEDTLSDGTADDLIEEALQEANNFIKAVNKKNMEATQ